MKQMSIDELASSLGEAIQQVCEGETVQVTNHGEVVAMLVPVPKPPAVYSVPIESDKVIAKNKV